MTTNEAGGAHPAPKRTCDFDELLSSFWRRGQVDAAFPIAEEQAHEHPRVAAADRQRRWDVDDGGVWDVSG